MSQELDSNMARAPCSGRSTLGAGPERERRPQVDQSLEALEFGVRLFKAG